ncbi:MAG: ABC transporter ATP-binding protein [Myxococcales bacterium]|nr:ABC transporter ATP-binding protein [Myxococcales bacterium]
MATLLAASDLTVHFPVPGGTARAVDGISFTVQEGEIVGMVGESGCGKSVTALALMRLLPERQARIGGRIEWRGQSLTDLDETRLRKIRGREISMIFQDPLTSLNPVFSVGEQLVEPLMQHLGLSRAAALAEARNALERVGIERPEERLGAYPSQLSGGMRQRVMIAMAMATKPKLLIADEPTTALDVTTQAQVLRLIDELRRQTGTAVLFITHDLGVVAELCERVIVLYAGKIAESAGVADLFNRPLHPYTRGLLRAIHTLDRGGIEAAIPGRVEPATSYPPGCRFHPRCPDVLPRCRETPPPLFIREASQVACWLYEKVGG